MDADHPETRVLIPRRFTAKKAECMKQARMERFRRSFAARNQFLRQCMARQGKTAR